MGASPLSVNFDIRVEDEKELKEIINENSVTKKLCLSSCQSMLVSFARNHCDIVAGLTASSGLMSTKINTRYWP